MRILYIFLFILFNTSFHQCEIPPCKTNCTTNNECWQDALTYRSAELIEQLFSFSSLSVYITTYQQRHPSEVNDSILFIDKALENHLSNELINSSLSINLFTETKQMLIKFCENLTSVPIDDVSQLPRLMCPTSTCSSETMNFLVILIISILITGIIFLVCFLQSFYTYQQTRRLKTIPRSVSFINSLSTRTTSINFNANRF